MPPPMRGRSISTDASPRSGRRSVIARALSGSFAAPMKSVPFTTSPFELTNDPSVVNITGTSAPNAVAVAFPNASGVSGTPVSSRNATRPSSVHRPHERRGRRAGRGGCAVLDPRVQDLVGAERDPHVAAASSPTSRVPPAGPTAAPASPPSARLVLISPLTSAHGHPHDDAADRDSEHQLDHREPALLPKNSLAHDSSPTEQSKVHRT